MMAIVGVDNIVADARASFVRTMNRSKASSISCSLGMVLDLETAEAGFARHAK